VLKFKTAANSSNDASSSAKLGVVRKLRAKAAYASYLILSMPVSRVGTKCGIQNDSLPLLPTSMCSANGTRTAANICPISRLDRRVPETRSDRRA